MDTFCTYHIAVQGRVDGGELNAMSPHEMRVVQADAAETLFTVRTDQSGLVGLLRHLHGRGFVLLSITRRR
jgi:hypothetical protein